MRGLVLTTDAYGARGGIAKYNRDFLTALCSYEAAREVKVFPRLAPHPLEPLPRNLTFVRPPEGGRAQYAKSVLQSVALDGDFAYVVCGHINLVPIAWLAAVRARAPLIMLLYGIEVWKPTGSRLCNRLAQRSDQVVSISQVTMDRFVAWCPVRAAVRDRHICPNATSLSDYGPGPKDPKLVARYNLERRRVLLTVGRLSASERYKGFDEVLDVLPELRAEHPDLVYLVAGDGDDLERLQKKAQRLGLRDHVIFAGYVPEAEKLALYRTADVFVMPGSGEGFGFVYTEAMAAGIPAVASTLDGSYEAVGRGKLGVAVDPRDRNAVRRGILEALAKPRGVVPEGLDFFDYPHFERRVHAVLDHTLK